jgi:hypothetical protein
MKRIRFDWAMVASASVGLLASASALAGFHSGQAVVIIDAYHLVNGDLGYVHNTSDPNELIGCQNYGDSGYCYARNTAGIYRACSTSDPALVRAIRSLQSDSYLIFYWSDSGYCTNIYVETDSTTVPKR